MRNFFAAAALEVAPTDNLKHLGFQRYLPHPYLQAWVQCYWTVQGELTETGVTETLYADGGTTLSLVFVPQQTVQLRFNAYQHVSQIHLQGTLDRLGVRFHPGGAFQLLGVEMPDVVGGEYSGSDLASQRIDELQDRLGDASTITQRLTLLDDWLLQQAAYHRARQGTIQQLLPQLNQHTLTIDSWSDLAALSRRQLERKFQQEVGMTPVQLKQLWRIKHARQLISLAPERPLADVALAAGYYDQAHFIRQFQKVTGQTPNRYRHKKRTQQLQREHVAKIQ